MGVTDGDPGSLELRLRASYTMYQDGATAHEIVALLGVDPSTTRRWIRKTGVPLRRRGSRKRTDVSDDAVKEAVESGMSYREAATALGMSKTGVRYRYYGIVGRKRPDRSSG